MCGIGESDMKIGRPLSQVQYQRCEECDNEFIANGRNAQENKRFCSNDCARVNGEKRRKLEESKERKSHRQNCKCTFCKTNRKVNQKIFYIIHQTEILAKFYHSHRWS